MQELNYNMRELVDISLKLNLLAKEFVLLSLAIHGSPTLFFSPSISISNNNNGISTNNSSSGGIFSSPRIYTSISSSGGSYNNKNYSR